MATLLMEITSFTRAKRTPATIWRWDKSARRRPTRTSRNHNPHDWIYSLESCSLSHTCPLSPIPYFPSLFSPNNFLPSQTEDLIYCKRVAHVVWAKYAFQRLVSSSLFLYSQAFPESLRLSARIVYPIPKTRLMSLEKELVFLRYKKYSFFVRKGCGNSIIVDLKVHLKYAPRYRLID